MTLLTGVKIRTVQYLNKNTEWKLLKCIVKECTYFTKESINYCKLLYVTVLSIYLLQHYQLFSKFYSLFYICNNFLCSVFILIRKVKLHTFLID